MPLRGYFLYIGSALLALLLILNWYFPQPDAGPVRSDVDRSTIRIHSTHRWPQAVVIDTTLLRDSMMMETAGAQCLVLAGFFEDQMRRRHSIRWYAQLGATFFRRAAMSGSSPSMTQMRRA